MKTNHTSADLLAAAPDLLAALVACRDQLAAWVDSGSTDNADFLAVKAADAAIKKATTGGAQ